MSTGIIIAIVGLAFLAVVALVVLFRQKDTHMATGSLVSEPTHRDLVIKDKKELKGKDLEAAVKAERSAALEPAKDLAPEVYVPPDEETLGVNRRQFLNRGIFATLSLSLGTVGIGVLQNLTPGSSEGFGSRITVGRISDIKQSIKDGGGFFYFPEGRMWITEYPESALVKAETAYGFYDRVEAGLANGVVALFQTCPHLGCRVPECRTSQWFECPCHGSQYNRVGEKKGGPAPRGMDRFPMEVSTDGVLTVNTGQVILGPPIGVNTTGQEAEGPNCLSGGGGHS